MVAWQYHDNSLSPLANWPLDEYVGGEYEDISGNGLPLTVESGTQRDADLVPGFAGAWLDGSTRLVENTGDASLRLLGDWSIAFFVRPTAYPTAAVGSEMATHGVPNAETAESDNFVYQTKLTQTAARIAASWETTGQADVDVTTVAALVSHVGGHVAIVKRGLDVEVYLDTVLVATATAASQPVGGGSGKFRFGGGTTSAGLAAVVASLVVFDSAITPSELFGCPGPPIPIITGSIFPTQGSTSGGTHVVARALNLHLEAAQDLMTDATTVAADWTQSTSGTAYILPSADGTRMFTRAAASATSSASLTWATAQASWHAKVDTRIADVTATSLDGTGRISLVAYIDNSNYASVSLAVQKGLGRQLSGKLIFSVVEGGTSTYEHELPVRYTDTVNLGLLKHGGQLLFFINETEVARTLFSSAVASPRLEIVADDGARVLGVFRNYQRLPVVTIGSALETGLERFGVVHLIRQNRALFYAPPADRAHVADVYAYAESDTAIELGTFEYIDPYESRTDESTVSTALVRGPFMQYVANSVDTEEES